MINPIEITTGKCIFVIEKHMQLNYMYIAQTYALFLLKLLYSSMLLVVIPF